MPNGLPSGSAPDARPHPSTNSLMKPYLITTGFLFAAITVAHLYEAIVRGHFHHTDLLVLVSGGLSIWAWRLLRRHAA